MFLKLCFDLQTHTMFIHVCIHICVFSFSLSLHLSLSPSFLQKTAKCWSLNKSDLPLHEVQVLKTYHHDPPQALSRVKLLDLFCVFNHKLLLISSYKCNLPVVPALHTCLEASIREILISIQRGYNACSCKFPLPPSI